MSAGRVTKCGLLLVITERENESPVIGKQFLFCRNTKTIQTVTDSYYGIKK